MSNRQSLHRNRHVAIIGAGFSGSLQAINLLRHDGPRTTLIERRPHAGRGVAYSAAHPTHLLNVRAANMSALPDDPDHFVRWLAANHPSLSGFVPRIVYGDYLSALLAEAEAASEGRLTLANGDAVSATLDQHGVIVRLADGAAIAADTLILAPGNLPPHEPPGIADADLGADLYAADPWSGDVGEGLEEHDTVLIVGSGLTMVDVALLLDAQGYKGRIIAMSRRGLTPQAHADGKAIPSHLSERPSLSPADLLHAVRDRAAAIGWRAAVDELRPFTQDMWLAASAEDKRRFLRHLRPWWDIHRHRLAPAVAARLAKMRDEGRLDIVAGKIVTVERANGKAQATWRPRGASAPQSLSVRRIVNCSGPQGDIKRTTEPLLRQLLDSGRVRPDAHRLGIDVNPQAEVVGADGQANPRLIALGPMTRGTFWEIVAVPDIRVQTWSVAHRLSNAHWVEGEGL